MRSPMACGVARTPIISGTFGPYTSASISPTLMPKLGQRDRQIDGNRGLPHAAFAGSDGDQILHAGNRNFRLFLRGMLDPLVRC